MIYQPGEIKKIKPKDNSLMNSKNLFPLLFKIANLKMNDYVKTPILKNKNIYLQNTRTEGLATKIYLMTNL